MSISIEQAIQQVAAQLEAAGVHFGHGTDNAVDEAAELVFFAAGLRHEDAPECYEQTLKSEQARRLERLLERRIGERLPAAYLTQRMWFAGHEFYVDERVLVPRSPIAELVEARFEPWVEADKVRSILDIGAGSGCIAIACALAFESAEVEAGDVSPAALEVAGINVERYGLQERVRPVQSDVYSGVGARRYDLIVSNPPYVSHAEMAELPLEYLREPELGLRAGHDGLDIVRRILAGAESHLTPSGILVVEVGDSEQALIAAFPSVPFLWLEFERGGGGVFLLSARQLAECRKDLVRK